MKIRYVTETLALILYVFGFYIEWKVASVCFIAAILQMYSQLERRKERTGL